MHMILVGKGWSAFEFGIGELLEQTATDNLENAFIKLVEE